MTFVGPNPWFPPAPPPAPPAINDAALGNSFSQIASLQGDPSTITESELVQALTTQNATVGYYGYGNPYSSPYTPMSYAALRDAAGQLGLNPHDSDAFAWKHNGETPVQLAYELMHGQPAENADQFKASVTQAAADSDISYNAASFGYGGPWGGYGHHYHSYYSFMPPAPPPPWDWFRRA